MTFRKASDQQFRKRNPTNQFWLKVLMDRGILSSQFNSFGSLPRSLRQDPSVAWIPMHSAKLVFPRHPPSRQPENDRSFGNQIELHAPFVPGRDAPPAERLFFEDPVADRFHREILSFDSQPSLTFTEGRFFQQRPRSQNPILDDPQIIM